MWPPPRLRQLARIVRCWWTGHRWSEWRIDDYDGPGEELDGGGFMPYLSRESRDGEFGMRSCYDCRLMETRRPVV